MNVDQTEEPSRGAAAGSGFAAAMVVLVLGALVAGVYLSAAIGSTLAFLPALGAGVGILLGLVAGRGRSPRRQRQAGLVGAVVGTVLGVGLIFAYLAFLSWAWR